MSRNDTRGNKASHSNSNRTRDTQRSSGNKKSPEVLDEVKVNYNLHFYLKILLFILKVCTLWSLSTAYAKRALFIYTLVSKYLICCLYGYDSQETSLYAIQLTPLTPSSMLSIGTKDCVTSKNTLCCVESIRPSWLEIRHQQSQDLNIYEELKFTHKIFPFLPVTILPLPLMLNSWSKVQFWYKISTLTFSSSVDVLTLSRTFCVHNSILTRSRRTQRLVFEIRIWASTLLVLFCVFFYTESAVHVLYPVYVLVRSLQSAFYTWSAFYTRSAVRVLYLVRSPGPQSAVRVSNWLQFLALLN